jgi:dTDP-4-dehydrorhamnose 3,5-epimerase
MKPEVSLKAIVTEMKIPDVKQIKVEKFGDERGFFAEVYNEKTFKTLGLATHYVQDNHSRSAKDVLRGFHYQDMTAPQGKLVRCSLGTIIDLAVDIRVGSPTFGQHVSAELSADNLLQLYVPVGFAHAFLVLSDYAEVQYKCTGFYNPAAEGNIIWNDPDIAFPWPIDDPILSRRDRAASSLQTYLKQPAFIYGKIER